MIPHFLYVALFNARSVCNKLPELYRLLYHESQDVILITETWLNINFPDNLLDPESRYHIFAVIVTTSVVVVCVFFYLIAN